MDDVTPSCSSNNDSQCRHRKVEDIDISDIENLEIPPPPLPAMNFDGTGPRLLITHIVNENFKSYAGRHVLGPFHKNFTAIVGPNGSGKSNVIDSLLFVFGYRAQKIRSKKIGVLIHNSDQHPNIASCTVEIHFVKAIDKTEHEYDVVDGSQFVVSRTAYRDSTSEYRLNGKRVQFKEIGALLRETGIDLDHNRFLILQGEVEQIALMKPKALQDSDEGMLEYLEDIIGSSRLVPIIELLNRKCEELNEIRTEKANRVKVVESEKSELEASKDEAVDYLLLENEIIRKKNMLYHIHMVNANDNCMKMNEELTVIREEYEEHEAQMKNVKAEVGKKKEEYNSCKKELDNLMSAAEKHQAEFAKMEKDDAKAREDFKHYKNKSKKLTTSIENEKKKLEELKAQPEKADSQVQELNKKIKELEKRKPTLEAELQKGTDKLREETGELQTLKEAAETELAKVQENINEARSKVDIAQSELDVCLSAQTKEVKKLEELNAKMTELIESRTNRQDVLVKSEQEFARIDHNFREIQRQLRDVVAEETSLAEKLKTDRTKAEEARCALQQSNHSRGTVLSALLEEKRRGNIPGIIGRLGDLGAIDEQYDIAISTACGPLDNIVVDSIDTAQACVNFLKRRNLGQATFIGLDKMQRFADTMNQAIQTPENVPRLFDLIKVEDESVLPAFYFALRDTLVAPTLEQATRISLQGRVRWRVVTLQGHLIDTSGTMSGGGNRPFKGRMGRSVVQSTVSLDISYNKLKEMDEELNTIGRKLQAKRQARAEFEKQLDSLGRESQRLKILIEKCRAESMASTEEESRLKKQITAKERTVKNTVIDENQRKRLQKHVDDYKQEYERIDASAEKIRAKVDRYHKQIMEISERLVGSVQKKLDACQKELDDYRKSITKANVSVKNAERNFAKTEEQIAKLEQEFNENEENKKKLKARLNELETEGLKTVEAWEAIKANVVEHEKICVEIKKRLDEAEEKEQQIVATGMDKRQRLDHAEKVLKEFTQKFTHWKREIKKLKLNDLRDLKPISATDPKSPDEKRENEDNDQSEKEAEDKKSDNNNQSGSDGEDKPPPDQSAMADDGEKQTNRKRATSSSMYDKRYDDIELEAYDDEIVRKFHEKQIGVKLTIDEEKLKSMKPNLSAIEDYRRKLAKYNDCVGQLEHVTDLRDRVRGKFDELRKRRLTEFMTGFRVIATKLKEMYQMITLGGDADLDLVDTMDPFSEGIVFSVRPPKKSWKQISNLSGGEKTLSSLALVFALHHYKPTPLYVMDEIDAALDFRNVSIVANYIKERTKNAQFIIISLRNNMFELSDRLVGIYKTYQCTKSVTIDPDKICRAYGDTKLEVEGENRCMTTPVKCLRVSQPAV